MNIVIVVIVILVLMLLFRWWMCGDEINYVMLGGSIDDVVDEVQKNKLRENADANTIIQNVTNGINAYQRFKNIHVDDNDIEFIGQGFQNVVVRMGSNGPLVRVAKYIRPFMFKQFQYTFNMLRKYKDNGFLIPTWYRYEDGNKPFIIWEIKELEPIKEIDYGKMYECVLKNLEFINNKDIGLTYIDFKFENVMMDSETGKYLNTDFDMYKKFDIRDKLDDVTPDLNEYMGKTIDYCSDQMFAKKIAKRMVGDKYDGNVLFPSVFARIFMLKLKMDLKMGNTNARDSRIMVTDEFVKQLLAMKSTEPVDVLTFIG